MYDPKFYISNKLLNNIVNIEKELIYLEYTEINTSQLLKLRQTAKALNIFHFAHMINHPLTLGDAEKIADGRNIDGTDLNIVLLNNARNVHEFIRSSLQDDYIDIDTSILMHMNKILLSNWKELWDVKFRNPQLIEDTDWNDWLKLTDRTIEPLTLQDELKDAFDWYKISTQKLNHIIRISVLIYRLIKIAPFSHLNKFTIIAATDFLFKKYKILADDTLSTFRLFDTHNSSLIQISEKIDVENSDDVTGWIEIFTDSILLELQKLKTDKKSLNDNKPQSKTFLDLNKRQLKILKYLQTIPTVKREDYVQIMDVSTMTAFRDLNDLVTKKLLKIQGRARATKYMLTNR